MKTVAVMVVSVAGEREAAPRTASRRDPKGRAAIDINVVGSKLSRRS